MPDSCLPHPDPLVLSATKLWGIILTLLSTHTWGRAGRCDLPYPTMCPSLGIKALLFLSWKMALSGQTHLAGLSVLVQDEGHLCAVYLGRQPLSCTHIEHGQGGERPGHLTAGGHLPELFCVPMDGTVVKHLDAGDASKETISSQDRSLGCSLPLPQSRPAVCLPGHDM